MQHQPNDIESYKDAVWDYMLEHCDITDNGSFFVKFHTKNRIVFEKHIKARWKYNYHRRDERLNLSHTQKEIDARSRQEAHTSRKASKLNKYSLSKKQQRAVREALAKQKAEQDRKHFIHNKVMQPLAQLCYAIYKIYVKK